VSRTAVRPATASDLDAVAALHEARDLALRGEARTSREMLAAHWPEDRHWIVPGAGHASVGDGGGMSVCVPAGPAAGAAARALVAAVAAAHPGRLETVIDAGETDVAGVLEACGFAREHEAIEMTIDVDPAAGPVAAPTGVTLRRYDDGRDARAVHACLVAAFAGSHESVPPFESWHPWLTSDPAYDAGAVVVAEAGGEVVGVAQCWTGGWVKDLAVSPDHRGRGLGEALLREAFAELAARGVRRVGLKVDADNPTGAVRLYRRVGMRELRRHAVYGRC
jgi:ribosomal protein S18 acetylase RimI-like enzyme